MRGIAGSHSLLSVLLYSMWCRDSWKAKRFRGRYRGCNDRNTRVRLLSGKPALPAAAEPEPIARVPTHPNVNNPVPDGTQVEDLSYQGLTSWLTVSERRPRLGAVRPFLRDRRHGTSPETLENAYWTFPDGLGSHTRVNLLISNTIRPINPANVSSPGAEVPELADFLTHVLGGYVLGIGLAVRYEWLRATEVTLSCSAYTRPIS